MENSQLTTYTGRPTMDLERCILEWIDAKASLSESKKTEDLYRDYLEEFRELLKLQGLDLDSPASIIAPLARRWCNWSKRINEATGKRHEVTPNTYNQRRSVLKSFYDFALLHEVLDTNPMLRIERRKGRKTRQARSVASAKVREGLASIDRSTPEGRRDYTMIVLALASSRRVEEIASLRYGDIIRDGNKALIYWRGKGNKALSNTFDERTSAILFAYLETLPSRESDAPVWCSFSPRNRGEAISARTLQRISKTHMDESRFHAWRKTHAIAMFRKGASLAQISKDLGHSDIKTTLIYLEEALADENPYGGQLADEWGF